METALKTPQVEVTPWLSRRNNGGAQHIYRFANGYGASVVIHSFSYGRESGLWELGVVTFDDNDRWHLTYATPVTDDVLGDLTDADVAETLVEIAALPAVSA
jgi:hypothetical protein